LILADAPLSEVHRMPAERLQLDIFGSPFQLSAESVTLWSSIDIASSAGRSSVVVLHETERALEKSSTPRPWLYSARRKFASTGVGTL
jgi:hypothetical protein